MTTIDSISSIPSTFVKLVVPIPPDLDRTFGYDGGEHFVAFFWASAGDEFTYSDGRMTSTNGQWHAWQVFSNHPKVWRELYGYRDGANSAGVQRYDYGSSEAPAQHWLVIDRKERLAYAAPVSDARAFLRLQIPLPTTDNPMPVLTQAELDNFAEQMAERLNATFRSAISAITLDDIHARMQAQYEAEQQLEAWLNAYSVPSAQQGEGMVDEGKEG